MRNPIAAAPVAWAAAREKAPEEGARPRSMPLK